MDISKRPIGLGSEVSEFTTTADQVALGDLAIRQTFARSVVALFIGSNIFVLTGLGVVFWQDCLQLAAHQIGPAQRVIDGRVVMTLLGATTVQLGAVIFTIARAIFPAVTVSR